jgi:SAM-dependent methyltransferase
MKIFSKILTLQKHLSNAFDRLLPDHFRQDGHKTFRREFAPFYLRDGIEVWDVGGGKVPYVDAATRKRFNIHSVGLDISEAELAAAASWTYDEVFVSDITKFVGRGTADLIICQAVLEHVSDTKAALSAFKTILRPGGVALAFVPARNSCFARLNLMLPEKLKRKLLKIFHSEGQGGQGFPAYYDRCTAPEFRRMCNEHGLEIIDERLYHESGYFRGVFPIHVLWRLWILLAFKLDPARWAETFSIALRKPAART